MSNQAESRQVSEPKWDGGNVAALGVFLKLNPSFLDYLASKVPKIDTTSIETAALSGAKHAGYEELFTRLAEMATERPRDEQTPFIQ